MIYLNQCFEKYSFFAECFENSKNCFEQFTINYTNEKLQSFWAARLISKEMDLYEKEGMYIPEVKFFENSKILGN